MLNRLLLIIIFLVLNTFCYSCNDITRSEKFNKEIWNQYGSFDGPDRDLMAEDLIKTHRLIGLTNKQMLQLLGSPSNLGDTTKTDYELSQEFDSIDPISGKNLVIQFNKDSVITSASIEEWHKH
jgi:hypothetical protein